MRTKIGGGWIRIEKAREHNLKGISVDVPRHQLTVVTGVSGSGKSSLAFNIIYAEAQRRYLESLSPYARQFLHLFQKPDVERITGLAPAISVGQNLGRAASLSTVGTISEIYDYIRLLFYSGACQMCPSCGKTLQKMTISGVLSQLLDEYKGKRLIILAPLIRQRKGNYQSLFSLLHKKGYSHVQVDGRIKAIAGLSPARRRKHSIAVVVGRLLARERNKAEFIDILHRAFELGHGEIVISAEEKDVLFSLQNYCPTCHLSFPEPEPATFSFHFPKHRCPHCRGRGIVSYIPPELFFSDPTVSLGKLEPVFPNTTLTPALSKAWYYVLAHQRLGTSIYWRDLTETQRHVLLSETDPGVDVENPTDILLSAMEKMSDSQRHELERLFLRKQDCPTCHGSRLARHGRAFRLNGKEMGDIGRMPLQQLFQWVQDSRQTLDGKKSGMDLLFGEAEARLKIIIRIGLGYLTMNRSALSLSGGELQRLRLASRLQQEMSGVLYVLDEPSIGLHPADLSGLIMLLGEIRDQGNTVLIVEHDETTIRSADYVIDLGPGGGANGGCVLFAGTVDRLLEETNSITGQYLSGHRHVPLPVKRRRPTTNGVTLSGVTTHNLKNISVFFPFKTFITVTGVSGSGKSSLVEETLYPLLKNYLSRNRVYLRNITDFHLRGPCRQVVFVDQSPVGRTPRSTPATYTGIFHGIREFFARLPEAQARGFRSGHFSYNVSQGRCPQCKGLGMVKLEMKFLPDATINCSQCQGLRYQRDVLKVTFKGKSIADILKMSVSEARILFNNFPSIRRRLQILEDTGMGYVCLGQPTPTLSGGEQQRLKLANHLFSTEDRHTVFILDEPTTGLHFSEIEKLCMLLQDLVNRGNTVIAIEHNLDFIKQSDYLIDLGPGCGKEGGQIVFAGPAEEIVRKKNSKTGYFLKKYLNKD